MLAQNNESTANRYELPARIAAFAGQINDLDAHECVPVNRWVDEFGQEVQAFVDACTHTPEGQAPLMFNPDIEADEAEINSFNVWNLKMEQAPGAFDFDRRLQVMDFMGVHRQVMYPGGLGLMAGAFYSHAQNPEVMKTITGDRKAYAVRLLDIYNDWCARLQRGQDRLRPAAILVADTPDEFYERMKKLVDSGVRCVQIAPDLPPGGVSPASPELDRAWALAADANMPVLGHIGSSENLFKTLVWRDAPAFKGWMAGGEFSLDPWTLSNIHLPVQNYLTTMVLGGVFDRHPNLRFGTAEFTGHWVGPFAQNMDRWYAHTPFPTDIGERKLSMKPSDFVKRNVRVACFDFEPVGQYIDNFGFEDVLCYASDFPHYEGGKDPMNNFVKSLAGKSDEILRKFFVDNGKWLLPN